MAKRANPNEREWCKQKHAEAPSSVVAVRPRPPRSSIPKEIIVRPVLPSVIKPLITDFHYLHSMPAAARLCFGVYLGNNLGGAVVFTSGPRHGYKILTAAKPQDIAILARLWLSDDLPRNSESRVIGFCLRWIKKHRDWKILISYADPKVGHTGGVYQATGWQYLGQTAPGAIVELADGSTVHSRTCGDRYGSGSIRHLRNTGVAAIRRYEPGKHRYISILDPAWRWRLRATPMPYPKPEVFSNAP